MGLCDADTGIVQRKTQPVTDIIAFLKGDLKTHLTLGGKFQGIAEQVLQDLKTHYSEMHGIRLQEVKGQFQLMTAPEFAVDIETFLGLEVTSRLTQAALEALAIVAYKQPVTRPEIDSIRGVNSDGVLKSLLSKGLIEELGRSDAPGRPILYGTTPDFMQHFGLESMDQLPEIDFESLFSTEADAEGEDRKLLKD